jgi:hypothetical protein
MNALRVSQVSSKSGEIFINMLWICVWLVSILCYVIKSRYFIKLTIIMITKGIGKDESFQLKSIYGIFCVNNGV